MDRQNVRDWLIAGIVVAYFAVFFPWNYTGKFLGKIILNDHIDLSEKGTKQRFMIRDEGPKLIKIMEAKVKSGEYTIQEYFRDMDRLRLIELKAQLPFMILSDTEKFRQFIQQKYGSRKDFADLVDKARHQETPEKKQSIMFQKKIKLLNKESWNQACGMLFPLIGQIYFGSLPFAVLIIFGLIVKNGW